MKLRNILSIFSISIFTTGAVFSAVDSYKNSLKNYDKTSILTGKEKKFFRDSLNDINFASDTKVDPTDITLERLNDFIDISKTKLTYKLLFAGASSSENNPQVQNIVGTYLHNVTPTSDLDSKGLQQQYEKVKEENKKVGIDVVDYNEFKNYDAITLVDSYLNTFKSDGHTDADVESLKTILLANVSEVTNNAIENLDNKLDLSFEIADTQGFDEMSPDIDHRTAVINAKLASALKYEQSLFDDDQFQITPSSAEFLKYYSDYTTDGSTTPNPKIKPLVVGDVVPEELIQYLITYTYDTVYGADYAERESYGFDITPDKISANTNSEYDPTALGLCSYTQPLSSLNCQSCTYGLGEFIPGYALKLAIKSIDDTTDSHICKMVLTKGVSYTDSDNKEHILWDTKDGTLDSAKDDTQGDVTINVEIGNEYLDLIKNISSNVYYPNSEQNTVDFSAVTDISLSKNGGYFDSTKKTRKKLDEILENYSENTYDHFDTKPFYITGSDIENVLPSETKFPVSSFDGLLHDNQQFALIPTLVDSNNYTMDLMCGYIDKIDYIDKDGNKQQKTFVAKYNTFLISGQNYDKIKVQFDISLDLKVKINYAKTIYTLSKLADTQRSFFKNAKTKDDATSDVDKLSKTLASQIYWHEGYLITSDFYLAINEALSVYYVAIAVLQYATVFSIASGVATTVFVVLAIAGLAANTYALYSVSKSEAEIIKEKVSYINTLTSFRGSLSPNGKTISNIFGKINDKIYATFSGIKQYYNPLFDSSASFGNKKKAAEIIIDFTNNEDFLNTLIKFLHEMNIQTYDCQPIEDILKPIDFSKVTDDDDEQDKQDKQDEQEKQNNKIYKSTLTIMWEITSSMINSTPAIVSLVEKLTSRLSRCINSAYKEFLESISSANLRDTYYVNVNTFFNHALPSLAQSPFDNRFTRTVFGEQEYIQNHFESYKYFEDYSSFYRDTTRVWNKVIKNADCEELLQQIKLAFNEIGKSDWWPEFEANLLNICQRNSIELKDIFKTNILSKIDELTQKPILESVTTGTLKFYLSKSNENYLRLYDAIVRRTSGIAQRDFINLLSDTTKDAAYFGVQSCTNFEKFRTAILNDVQRTNFLENGFKAFLPHARASELQTTEVLRSVTENFENKFNRFNKTLERAEWARSAINSLSKFNFLLCPEMQIMLLLIPALFDLINIAFESLDLV